MGGIKRNHVQEELQVCECMKKKHVREGQQAKTVRNHCSRFLMLATLFSSEMVQMHPDWALVPLLKTGSCDFEIEMPFGSWVAARFGSAMLVRAV